VTEPPEESGGSVFCELYSVRLRLLNTSKPDPAIATSRPVTVSHSRFAPVVARFAEGAVVGEGVVVAAGADGVTALELADAAEVPPALVAVEEKV
jgi:hypothetical protein